MRVEETRKLRGFAVVKLAGIDTREEAAKWTNGGVAVLRADLPPLDEEGEFYWADLVGLRAVDEAGECFGEVCGLFRTGAHDVLRVKPDDDGEEILIPFVDAFIKKIERDEIHLRWRREW